MLHFELSTCLSVSLSESVRCLLYRLTGPLHIFAKAFHRLASGKADGHCSQYYYQHNPFYHTITPITYYLSISAPTGCFVEYWKKVNFSRISPDLRTIAGFVLVIRISIIRICF
jgi:hypothetical protein